VPLEEVLGFLAALGVDPGGPIDEPTRERLAILTGSGYVIYGRIAELGGSVTLEPRIDNRRTADPDDALVRLEYLHGRTGTTLNLEKTILFRTAKVLEADLTDERIESLREPATKSALALQLFGEALWLREVSSQGEAFDRAQRAVAQDPEFELAIELRTTLEPGHPPAVAGETAPLRAIFEDREQQIAQAETQADMLTGTTEHGGLVGGRDGEQRDLSINRPAATGNATVIIRMPR
jgi:hypothetical protein